MIDVQNLAKLRIAIARFGEMDRFKWWNTKGVLGNLGELAISRGFPKTEVFARCRAVFAVAGARCDEVFNPPDSFTLWRLPVDIEDQFEDAWAGWLDNPEPWKQFLASVEAKASGGLLSMLTELELVSRETTARVNRLRRADDLRSVHVKIGDVKASDIIEILAAAYSCGDSGKLAIPFVRQQEFPE